MTSAFDDLDRALTAANLKRARTRWEFAERGTRAAAEADEQAWAEADRIGVLYLEARFEHEARLAGLYVDQSVFEHQDAQTGVIPTPVAEDGDRYLR